MFFIYFPGDGAWVLLASTMSGRLADLVNVMEHRHRKWGFDIGSHAGTTEPNTGGGEGADHLDGFRVCKSRERGRLQEWIGWQHQL